MVDIFDVLADDTRRDILLLLRQREAGATRSDEGALPGESSVGELVERLGLTQPTVSKHLKVLRDHQLVQVREDGQRRYYRLTSQALGPVRSFLDGVAPGASGEGLGDVVDAPYVDLWPAGYQVGALLGRLREALQAGIHNRF
ncbi:metalloregulator ArsR/SmtB family transcription factor [Pontimonas sp.]|uniref:ArsR/SmtB family transcription factor n=1 Tax=Pontimonas sp. TaxID=2304492 RepID=UPI00286FCC20|nr:metalloregulator ArsR/SmtB family transcription factor [Pontimonas sp.]MDR9396171.1 metalloregulator ArsR/SmtB family transcription factor [Pontimonas sp.]MDR9434538.1 metalloregulator ArsR/SmtB family transcription factor [Pontimonas sp.]